MSKPVTKLYTDPEICPKSPTAKHMKQDWVIQFRYYDQATGRWVPKQLKKGINYFKVFKDRLAEANALLETVKDELKAGWNPLTKSYNSIGDEDLPDQGLGDMSFGKALDFGLSQCKISPDSIKEYRSAVKQIKVCSKKVAVPGPDGQLVFRNYFDKPINQVKRGHIRLILDQCCSDKKWTDKAFNKHLGSLQAVLSRLLDYDAIEYNPAHKIKPRLVTESKKYIPFTEAQKKIIREHIFLNHYGYFAFLMVMYDTGIRPKEILALKISDIDFAREMITIIPDRARANSKTRKVREIPLNGYLLPTLREWVAGGYPKDYHVFGSCYGPGGNRGRSSTGATGAMHPDYFKPSPFRIKRDTTTRLWETIVIKGLGIPKYQYCMKHTGSDDKIMAGIDLDALKNLYGHTSKYMTLNYITKLKQIQDNQIKALSPAFIQKKAPV